MDEISSQASQLKAYESVRDIEKNRMEENMKKTKNVDSQVAEANQLLELQLEDERAFEVQEELRKSLMQEVVAEAEESGNPLPKSVLKLMNHYKG